MLFCCWIDVTCGVSIVNCIDLVQFLAEAHQKILRFDVTMQITLEVKIFNVVNHLVCNH